MEFIISKRKDLSFIGPEFSSVLRADDEAKIHVELRCVIEVQEIEFEYPEIHSIVYKDFEKACENVNGINKRRIRGVELFKEVCCLFLLFMLQVNKECIQSVYPKIENKVMEEFLDIMWNQMTFYEKKVDASIQIAKCIELDGKARCLQFHHRASSEGHEAVTDRAKFSERGSGAEGKEERKDGDGG